MRQHLPALFGKAGAEGNQRVLTDYCATIAGLLLENYTQARAAWAHGHGARIRNQAHGSPANSLDLYAATDIPETAGENLTRIKFASSAAHVTGKPLTLAETATWENDHFLPTLSDVKKAVDRMLLGGVNRVFYHGTAYSPLAAAWPGWLFCAVVEFSPQNPLWQDFSQLNRYAVRCQSFLQAGQRRYRSTMPTSGRARYCCSILMVSSAALRACPLRPPVSCCSSRVLVMTLF
ncbi:MAG: hypothetical protein EOO55_00675 [Hymenobacter sp.]|nr:MAG: hypothetical protein EOO55_00675 [Hymenobacter sp.]